MKTITIFLNVRKNSQRCHNKLLRPFGKTTLFEIALKKLEKISADEKFLCAYEKDFFSYEHDSSIKEHVRTKRSVFIDGPLIDVFECFNYFNSEYVMFLNPCHAHLKVETIQSAIDFFKNSNYQSLTSVEETKDWIFDDKYCLIYPPDNNHGDTKKTGSSFRVAHAFHIYDRKKFLENDGFLWTWMRDDPYLFKIPKIECVDVDDEDDFLISKSLYLNGTC